MIRIENGVFSLETQNTSYLFRVTTRGHLEHVYYGARVSASDVDALAIKNTIMLGTTVAYDARMQHTPSKHFRKNIPVLARAISVTRLWN